MTKADPDAMDPTGANEQRLAKRLGMGDLGWDLLAFVWAVVCVNLFDWKAQDLIWGLWASSLCVGYAYIVTAIVASVVREPRGQRVSQALGGLFLLAFFSVHFGMFHFVHSVFLNGFFPLVGSGKSFPDPLGILLAAVAAYWPFVLASFISRVRDFPLKGVEMKSKNPFMKPYANVIRMHLLIFVFAGLHGANLSHFAIYPVLVFYFFPWGKVVERARRARTSNVEL